MFRLKFLFIFISDCKNWRHINFIKCVNIAVSFFADTKRSATFRLNIESLERDSERLPPAADPIEGFVLTASDLVTLPSFPVPFISAASMPFQKEFSLQPD